MTWFAHLAADQDLRNSFPLLRLLSSTNPQAMQAAPAAEAIPLIKGACREAAAALRKPQRPHMAPFGKPSAEDNSCSGRGRSARPPGLGRTDGFDPTKALGALCGKSRVPAERLS